MRIKEQDVHKIMLLICVLGICCLARSASAVDSTASAKIRQALTLTKDSLNTIGITNGNLMFGSILPTSDGGVVRINPTKAIGSSLLRTSDMTKINETIFGWASFLVTGSPSYAFTITVPMNDTSIITSGANSMAVNYWECSQSNRIMSLSVDGTASFKIGATLEVGLNQPDGTYTGTFSVSVAYN